MPLLLFPHTKIEFLLIFIDDSFVEYGCPADGGEQTEIRKKDNHKSAISPSHSDEMSDSDKEEELKTKGTCLPLLFFLLSFN